MMKAIKMFICFILMLQWASVSYADVANAADKKWRAAVVNYAALPTIGNLTGDVRYCYSTNQLYGWNGSAWVALAGTGIGDMLRVSATDTTSGYLNTKQTVGIGISKTITSGGGDERLELNVLYDNSSIAINGSNQLYIKANGVRAAALYSDTAGDGLVLDGGTNALKVNVDDATIEIATDVVRVKDGGVTQAKLDVVAPPTDGYILSYDAGTGKMQWILSAPIAAAAEQVVRDITKASHGFSVGNVLKWVGPGINDYALAQADSVGDAEVVGIVIEVPTLNNFKLLIGGWTNALSGLTAGEAYFLSPTTPGLLTLTEPSTPGQVSKPVLIASSTVAGYFYNFRGAIVPPVTYDSKIYDADADTVVDTEQSPDEDKIHMSVGATGEMVRVDSTGLTVGYDATGPTVNTEGSIKLISAGNNAFYTKISAGTQTEATSYTWPTDYPGSNGLALVSTTGGVMSWATVVGGSDTYVQYNDSSALSGESTFTYTKGTDTLTVVKINPNGGDNTGSLGEAGVRWASIYGTNIYSGDITMLNNWVITEDQNGKNGIILKSPDGRKFKFVVEEIK